MHNGEQFIKSNFLEFARLMNKTKRNERCVEALKISFSNLLILLKMVPIPCLDLILVNHPSSACFYFIFQSPLIKLCCRIHWMSSLRPNSLKLIKRFTGKSSSFNSSSSSNIVAVD